MSGPSSLKRLRLEDNNYREVSSEEMALNGQAEGNDLPFRNGLQPNEEESYAFGQNSRMGQQHDQYMNRRNEDEIANQIRRERRNQQILSTHEKLSMQPIGEQSENRNLRNIPLRPSMKERIEWREWFTQITKNLAEAVIFLDCGLKYNAIKLDIFLKTLDPIDEVRRKSLRKQLNCVRVKKNELIKEIYFKGNDLLLDGDGGKLFIFLFSTISLKEDLDCKILMDFITWTENNDVNQIDREKRNLIEGFEALKIVTFPSKISDVEYKQLFDEFYGSEFVFLDDFTAKFSIPELATLMRQLNPRHQLKTPNLSLNREKCKTIISSTREQNYYYCQVKEFPGNRANMNQKPMIEKEGKSLISTMRPVCRNRYFAYYCCRLHTALTQDDFEDLVQEKSTTAIPAMFSFELSKNLNVIINALEYGTLSY